MIWVPVCTRSPTWATDPAPARRSARVSHETEPPDHEVVPGLNASLTRPASPMLETCSTNWGTLSSGVPRGRGAIALSMSEHGAQPVIPKRASVSR